MTMKQLLMMCSVSASLALAGGPAFADVDPESDECGANALQDRIGQPVTGTTPADLNVGGQAVSVTAKAVRVVGPNDAMTMDFRSDRLTIEVDDDGNLVSARCV